MAHIEKYQATALGRMLGHYERRFELLGYERDNIDPERTHLNYNLGPEREIPQVEFVRQRIAALGLRSVRKDAVRVVDTVVTLPKGYDGDSREFFQAVKAELDGMFGGENCVSAYVHLDEATPHMHYASVPVTSDGRLSAKTVLNRNFLKGFHERLESGVAQRLGRERVGLTLTDEERERRAGEYVGLAEFQDACAATEQAERELERVTAERDQAREELAEVAAERDRAREEVSTLHEAMAGLQERFRELVAAITEVAETMHLRPWFGSWKHALEALRQNPIAKAAVAAGQPWQSERDAKKAEKVIKHEVKAAKRELDSLCREAQERAQVLAEENPGKESRLRDWSR